MNKNKFERIAAAIVVLFILPFVASAQDEGGLDHAINEFFEPITAVWESIVFWPVPGTGGLPLVVVLLVVGALFFTLYFNPLLGHGN